MNTPRTILLALLVSIAIGAARASAQFNSGIIDLNYDAPYFGDPGYGPGAGAIGSASDLWNIISLTNEVPVPLETTDGSSSGATWTLDGGGGPESPFINGAYATLVECSCSLISATITGLTPNQQFNLYFYEAYWGETVDVNGVDFTTPGIRYGTVDSLTDGNEYDVETVTADSNGTLTFTPVSAQYNNPYISSWQLTPVPEPPVGALLALGAVALFGSLRVLPVRAAQSRPSENGRTRAPRRDLR
jgi:hypothetical protein